MQETIEKLLVLQDRDRRIHRVQQELAQIGPERDTYHTKATATQAQLEIAKTSIKQIESDRKRLELDVETKKQQIEKYANQQLQTRRTRNTARCPTKLTPARLTSRRLRTRKLS